MKTGQLNLITVLDRNLFKTISNGFKEFQYAPKPPQRNLDLNHFQLLIQTWNLSIIKDMHPSSYMFQWKHD